MDQFEEKFYTNVFYELPKSLLWKENIIDEASTKLFVQLAMDEKENRNATIDLLSKAPENLHVVTDQYVDRINFYNCENRGFTATGLSTVHRTKNDDSKTFYGLNQGGEVIVCAGSLGTPAILQRSGIGPKAVLGKKLCFVSLVFACELTVSTI